MHFYLTFSVSATLFSFHFSLSLSIYFVSLQPSFLFAFHTNTYFFSLLSSSLPLLFQAIFSDLNHSPYSVSPHWYLSQPAAGQISSYPFLISILLTVPLQNPASLSLYLFHTHALSHTHAHCLTHTHCLTHSLSNTYFLSPNLSLLRQFQMQSSSHNSPTLSFNLSHTLLLSLHLTLSLSLLAIKSLSHSHSHSLSRSLRGPLTRKQLELIQMFNTNKTTDSSSWNNLIKEICFLCDRPLDRKLMTAVKLSWKNEAIAESRSASTETG